MKTSLSHNNTGTLKNAITKKLTCETPTIGINGGSQEKIKDINMVRDTYLFRSGRAFYISFKVLQGNLNVFPSLTYTLLKTFFFDLNACLISLKIIQLLHMRAIAISNPETVIYLRKHKIEIEHSELE
ncbi:hypothetical protein CLU81_0523 [Flavobacterium sp. 9]|nr:hypothetical protein CLU81_0523 [Flavobacterium sp. 9]